MSSAMEIEPDHTAQDVDYLWFSKRQIVKDIIDVDEKRERTAIRYEGQQIDGKTVYADFVVTDGRFIDPEDLYLDIGVKFQKKNNNGQWVALEEDDGISIAAGQCVLFSDIKVKMDGIPMEEDVTGDRLFNTYDNALNYMTLSKINSEGLEFRNIDFDTTPSNRILKKYKAGNPEVEHDVNNSHCAKRLQRIIGNKEFLMRSNILNYGGIFQSHRLVQWGHFGLDLKMDRIERILIRSEHKGTAEKPALRCILSRMHVGYTELTLREKLVEDYKVRLTTNLDPLIFPYQYINKNDYNINKDERSKVIDLRSQTMQKLPNAMIVMLQSDKNYHGDLDTNSFAFHHFDVEMMKCEVSQDSRRYNSKIVDVTDYDNKIIKEFELQQVFQQNAECRGISKRQFNNANDGYLQPMLNLTTYLEDKGLVVFAKNFDPEVTTEDETTTLSVGPMRLRIQFKEPLEDTIKCVVYVIQDGQFEYSFGQSKFAWSYSTNVISA